MFLKKYDYLPQVAHGPLPTKLLPFIWHFVRQMKLQFFAIFILFSISSVILSVIPYFIQVFIEGLEAIEDRDDIWVELKWPIISFVGLVLIAQPVIVQIGGYIQAKTYPHFSNMVRRQLALYMHRHSYQYYQEEFAGRLAGKVIETPSAMNETMYALLGAVLYAVIMFCVSMVLYINVGVVFGLIALVWLIFYGALMFYYVPRVKVLSKLASDERSHLRGRFVDVLSNVLTVKLFARSKYEDTYMKQSLNKTASAFIKMDLKLWSLWSWLEVLTTAIWVATLLMAIYQWQEGNVSTAQFAMLLPLTLQVTQTSWWISEILTALFQRLGEIQEGMTAIVQTQSVQDKEGAKDLKFKKGDIAFKNVDFAYGGKKVFENLNVHIPAGQKVGLIGASGAGKSTLVQIFLRLYDLDKGSIEIDGQAIADVVQESARQQISVIPQMSDLLHRTIRENIAYGRLDATDEDMIAAAKKAQAHDFIVDLEDKYGNKGYDVYVGERGVRLSGGQRQRIAIARAILKDAPILVLDEATSALDSESEKLIQASLLDLMENKTVIAIAHRLSTIAGLDRLLVMQEGKIIEDGTHDELLALDGYYARLWNMQSGGFLKPDV